MSSWSILVKIVGKLGDNASNDFVFHVHPDDYISSVNDLIEKSTGLKAEQQRLIYRGRIMCGAGNQFESISDEPKFKDIVGLEDGQTIHVVPRLGPTIYKTRTSDNETNPLAASLASKGMTI
jgi:Ubiquitin family